MEHPCCDPRTLDYLDADMPDVLGLAEYKMLAHISKGHEDAQQDAERDSMSLANINMGGNQTSSPRVTNDVVLMYDEAAHAEEAKLNVSSPLLGHDYRSMLAHVDSHYGGISTHDLILLTDFVNLPDLILALSLADDRFDINSFLHMSVFSPI